MTVYGVLLRDYQREGGDSFGIAADLSRIVSAVRNDDRLAQTRRSFFLASEERRSYGVLSTMLPELPIADEQALIG